MNPLVKLLIFMIREKLKHLDVLRNRSRGDPNSLFVPLNNTGIDSQKVQLNTTEKDSNTDPIAYLIAWLDQPV